VEYKIKSKGLVAQLTSTSNARGDHVTSGEPASASTKLLKAKLQLNLEGPSEAEAEQTANYTVKVSNQGSWPLNRFRVTLYLPQGCKPARISEGGVVTRNALVWDFDGNTLEGGPLKAGQTFELGFSLKASTAGAKTITADVDAGPGLEESRSVRTNFSGEATLAQRVELEPGTIAVGQPGIIRVTVKNRGNQTSRKVTLLVNHEPGIEIQPSPDYTSERGRVQFRADDLLPGAETVFVVRYLARTAGPVNLDLRLSSQDLKEPLQSNRTLTIQR
jgi:hypothetical protein